MGTGNNSVRFNRSGTRLLCSGKDPQIVVFDLPTSQQQRKIVLKASGFDKTYCGWLFDASCFMLHKTLCFMGINDNLVISGSNNLYIWSLPDAQGQDCTVDQPLCVLDTDTGHGRTQKDFINCVRYSNDNSTVVSCDDDGVIKLWTPKLRSTD